LLEAFPQELKTVEKKCELLLPVVFCNHVKAYRSILFLWMDRDRKLPDGNLTEAFLLRALEEREAVCGFKHPRFQVTFNHPINQLWIHQALNIMMQCVKDCKKCSVERVTFRTVLGKLVTMKQIGALVGQHLIHCMALAGLLPERIATQAKISETTKTRKRLEELGVGHSSFDSLMVKVKQKYPEMSEAVAENGICKNLQVGNNSKPKDCICGNQKYAFNVELQKNGNFAVRRLFRKKGKGKQTESSTKNGLHKEFDYDKLEFQPPVVSHKGSRAVSSGQCLVNWSSHQPTEDQRRAMLGKLLFTSRVSRKKHTHYGDFFSDQTPDESGPKKRRTKRGTLKKHATLFGMKASDYLELEQGDEEADSGSRSSKRARFLEQETPQEKITRLLRAEDLKSFHEDRMRYDTEMARQHFNKIIDTPYGCSSKEILAQQSRDLREIHAIGQLRLPSNRMASNAIQEENWKGSMKTVTFLLANNVNQVKFDLQVAAEMCWCYSLCVQGSNASAANETDCRKKTGNPRSYLRLAIHCDERKIGKNSYWTPCAELVHRVTKVTVHGPLYMDPKHRRRVIRVGLATKAGSDPNMKDGFRFAKKKQAKRSMLWYIFSVLGDPGLWLSLNTSPNSWVEVGRDSATADRYLLLGEGMDSTTACKGGRVFATLRTRPNSNGGVQIRIEEEFSKEEAVEKKFQPKSASSAEGEMEGGGVLFDLTKTDPYTEHRVAGKRRPKKRNRKKIPAHLQEGETQRNGTDRTTRTTEDGGGACSGASLDTSQHAEPSIDEGVPQAEERQEIAILKDNEKLDWVHYFDPFSMKKTSQDEAVKEVRDNLSRWKPFWSDLLCPETGHETDDGSMLNQQVCQHWRVLKSLRSTAKLRPDKHRPDKYWIPPGVPVSSTKVIRSTVGLTNYLDYLWDGAWIGEANQTTVYGQWCQIVEGKTQKNQRGKGKHQRNKAA